jgi:hypothetical protein
MVIEGTNTIDRKGIPADNVNWDAGMEVCDKWTIRTFAISDTAVMKEFCVYSSVISSVLLQVSVRLCWCTVMNSLCTEHVFRLERGSLLCWDVFCS